jgi:hypothetical protein
LLIKKEEEEKKFHEREGGSQEWLSFEYRNLDALFCVAQ